MIEAAMESRRERFRRQLARLAGTGDPKEAIDAGLYVPRPTWSGRLVRRIELQPSALRVITGPIGSGKSTELLVLANELNRLPELWAMVIDVSSVHSLRDLPEGSLIAAAGVFIQETLNSSDTAFRRLRVVAYGEEDPFFRLKSSSGNRTRIAPPADAIRARGLLQDPANRAGAARTLVPYLLDGIAKLRDAGGIHLVMLFDSLDRVRDPSEFRNVLANDARVLVEHGVGVVLTAPVSTIWSDASELRAMTETWDILPYTDPATDGEAREFLLELLRRRADRDLLPEPTWLPLVEASGGVLRDLIELARSAVEEAYLEGHEAVESRDIDTAIAGFARALSLGLDGNAISTLLSVQATRRVRAFDEPTIRLLMGRQILEHRDSSGSYFTPHPVLASLLRQWAEAS